MHGYSLTTNGYLVWEPVEVNPPRFLHILHVDVDELAHDNGDDENPGEGSAIVKFIDDDGAEILLNIGAAIDILKQEGWSSKWFGGKPAQLVGFDADTNEMFIRCHLEKFQDDKLAWIVDEMKGASYACLNDFVFQLAKTGGLILKGKEFPKLV